MLCLDKLKYQYRNERDIEHPAIIDFIDRYPLSKSILDVGAWMSSFTYGKEFSRVSKRIGIDIQPPYNQEELNLFNQYIVGNILDYKSTHDLVTCISVIEHCGLSTYKTIDHKKEQIKVFTKLCEVTDCALLVTAPYGLPGGGKEFQNVTRDDLEKWGTIAIQHNFSSVKTDFYYNRFAQGGELWTRIDINTASNNKHDRSKGCQTVCIAEYSKR